MKEYYIDKTNSLHECHGEIHIVFYDEFEEEEVCLIWNASELLRDIPHLYHFAKRAKAKEEEHQKTKYKELIDEIHNDIKKPVGRPPKD